MSTRLVQGGKISDGVFYQYDKGSKSYVDTGQKVNASDFGKTEVGKSTPYSGDNPYVASFSQMYKPKGAVSSASAMMSKNQDDARIQAGNALVSDGGGQSSPYSNVLYQANQYGNQLYQNQQGFMQDQQNLLGVVDVNFDAALARSNNQYSNAISDLNQSMQRDLGVAQAQAAALNPYSEANGAMTSRNFSGAIQDKYQKQEARLREAAQIAQGELEAKRYDAYIQIQNSMKESQRQFNAGMQKFMMDSQAQAEEARRWDASFGLQTAQFNLDKDAQFKNDFYGYIERFGTSLQPSIDNFFQTGQITEDLMPVIQAGMQVGMSPTESLAVASHETQTQRESRLDEQYRQNSFAVQWYSAETSRLNYNLAATKAIQDAMAANQGISDARADRANQIFDFGMRAFDILKQGDTTATGFSGTFSQWLPGTATQADTLQGYYDTILSNVSLSEMQKLKDESKTGSTGFGQQSDAEFKSLRDAMGQLDVGNSVTVQQNNLARIMAAQHNLIQLHAAATGQIDYSPVLITADEVKAEFMQNGTSGQTDSGVTWKVVDEN